MSGRIASLLVAGLLWFLGAPVSAEQARPIEATSFGGQPLQRYEIAVEKRAEVYERIAMLEAKRRKSEADYETLGYLYIEVGRFQGAIDLYSRGLEVYPDSFRLLRHRGHRFLNVRQLERAIADLERAAELIGDAHRGVVQYRLGGDAFGTYDHWVSYHIGLYHYFQAHYDEAAEAFARCVTTARSDAHRVGAVDWLYNSLMKAGRSADARAALAQVPAALSVPDDYVYWVRLRVYRGEIDPAPLLDLDLPGTQWSGRDVTIGYGVATWLAQQGEQQTAQRIFDAIGQAPPWSAWAAVATDSEQSR